METVLVTGATGHLGRAVIDLLKERYRIRALARRPPGAEHGVEWVAGDLATGGGVSEAMTDADIVVHAATLSPTAQRGYPKPGDFRHSPTSVDVAGTERLVDEAERRKVQHFLYVSMVGAGRPRRGYPGVKHLGEDTVRAAGVPWSILRATPFHWLLDRMLERASRLPALPAPTDLVVQPADHTEFATYLVDCLERGPGRQRPDFGGPDIIRLGELAHQWSEIRGRPLRVLGLPTPRRLATLAADFTCPNGRLGSVTWSAWLHAQRPRALTR